MRGGWIVGMLIVAGCTPDAEPPDVALVLNGTQDPGDDFVVVSSAAAAEPAFTSLRLELMSSDPLTVALSSVGPATLDFEPREVPLTPGVPAEVKVIGASSSVAEADTRIEVSLQGTTVASLAITAIGGVKIGFSGTFGFATDNNNGETASMQGVPFTPCNADPDPEVWRATPLPCEGLAAAYGEVIVEEVEGQPERWSLASGKRPPLHLEVTRVSTFDPVIDLSGRDPILDVGTPLGAASGRVAARMFTDDCDGDPTTGSPLGYEQGVEVLSDFNLRLGTSIGVAYRDADPNTVARVWTAFPAPPSAAEVASDEAAVADLFGRGETGCSTSPMTYIDAGGSLVCDTAQSVKQLLERHVGFRAMIRRAWANWTSRQLVTTSDGADEASFVARLFRDAARGGAEGFMQLEDYDWFTLVGRVDKGLLASAGGVPARFDEWTQAGGCPQPSQPDEAEDDDPF